MTEPPRLRLILERAQSGYRLRDAATDEIVRWEDPRILVIPVAGVSFRPESLEDDSFEPGRRLALVPEPDNEHDPNAVAVWNELGSVQCLLAVDASVRPGTVSLPKGIWRKSTLNRATGTALVPDTLTDLGGGACFNDARVEVELSSVR